LIFVKPVYGAIGTKSLIVANLRQRHWTQGREPNVSVTATFRQNT